MGKRYYQQTVITPIFYFTSYTSLRKQVCVVDVRNVLLVQNNTHIQMPTPIQQLTFVLLDMEPNNN